VIENHSPVSENPTAADALAALQLWPQLIGARPIPLAGGLVHRSWSVAAEGRAFVLQRVSPVFSPRIHDNIEAVTAHLAAAGLPTLRLVPTRDGAHHADLGPRGRWRLVTRLPGTGFDVCESPELARSAAALVAGFHVALRDFEAPLHPLGFVFHDTPSHLVALERATQSDRAHRLHAEVAALARRIFAAVQRLPALPVLPGRVIHGDLKFSNVLFVRDAPGAAWRAHALIDLDTLSRLPLWVELGDALRSWCNRRGEDCEEAELDLGFLRAAVEGYLAVMGAHVERAELASLVEALERIALELAARFATDALEDRYFGWDREHFPACGEHNLLRARGQLSLAEQARASRDEQRRLLLG